MRRDNQNFSPNPFVLNLNPPKKGYVRCEAFVFEPQNIEEVGLGSLYIVGFLFGATENTKYLLNAIASSIKREYYKNPKRAASKSLESSLHQANLFLAETAQQGPVEWSERLSVCAAVITDGQLHATKAGQGRLFLWREGNLMDLGEQFSEAAAIPNPTKMFKNIISGELLPNDKLLLATPTILETSSIKQLEQLLYQSPPNALKKLSSFAQEAPKPIPLGSILVDFAISLEPAMPEDIKIKPRPADQENTGARIKVGSQIKKIFRPKAFKSALILKARRAALSLAAVTKFLKGGLRPEFVTVNYQDKKISKSRQYFEFSKNKIIAGAIIVALGAGGIYFNVKIRQKEKNLKLLSAIINQVAQHRQDAKNALIFNDRQRASLFIFDALRMLQEAPRIKEKTAEINNLKDSLNAQIDEINAIIRLNELTALVDFNKSGFNFKASAISLSPSGISVFAPATNLIYQFNQYDQTGRYAVSNLPKDFFWQYFSDGDDSIFLGGPGGIIAASHDTLSAQDMNFPKVSDNLGAMMFYKQYLYFYDSQSTQIVKCHTKTARCLTAVNAQPETVDLISLAHDGNLYFSNAQNNIYKFNANQFSEIARDFYPELERVSKIITRDDLNYLYILDSDAGRIIIAEKNGKLIKQMFSPSLVGISDLAIAFDEKTGFALSQNRLFEVEF